MINRALLVLSCLLLVSQGCGYSIYVRGNLEPQFADRFAPGTTIAVQDHGSDPVDAETERQTTAKINRMLIERGFELGSTADSDLLLFYRYERESTFKKIVMESWSGTSGIHSVRVEPPFNHSLVMRVVDGTDFRDKETATSCWNGEAVLNNTHIGGTKVIDLLLVASFDYFPKSTESDVKVSMGLENRRARELRAE